MQNHSRHLVWLAATIGLLVAPSIPTSHSTAFGQGPPPPKCDSPEHRQFDFWVGEWQVTTPDGRVAGTNRIGSILDDCVVHERWEGSQGMRGESFSMWDRDRRRWHQTWVDSRGQLLLLDGTFENGAMTLTGESGSAGARVLNRVTWTPAKDATVRQVWDVSSDSGKTWRTVFDGAYRAASRTRATTGK